MAKLILTSKGGEGREFELKPAETFTIGKKGDNHLVLDQTAISRHHCQVAFRKGRWVIEDLASKNGTYVNGKRIAEEVPLLPGAQIQLGDFMVAFEDDQMRIPVGMQGGRGAAARPAAARAAPPAPPPLPSPSPASAEPRPIGDVLREQGEEPSEPSIDPPVPSRNRTSLIDLAGIRPPPAAAKPPARPAAPRPPPPPPPPPPRDEPAVPERPAPLAIPAEIRKRVHERLLGAMDLKRADFSKSSEKDLYLKAAQTTRSIVESMDAEIPESVSRERLVKEVVDEALGLGPLEDLLADPEIDEIMVNDFDRVYVERRGRIEKTAVSFMDGAHLLTIIRRILSPIGRRVDETSPMVDARLPDGSRVNAIIPPLAVSGPTLTIRKFAKTPFQIGDLVRLGTLEPAMAEFCRMCVETKKNICISGGTGSGKTTLLNVLAAYVPYGERIVTIEDAAELRLPQEHVVSLESKPANLEGQGAIGIRQLVINSLRMRPDRIIVGECRGGEALDMLQAMNTGHEGSMTTVHANSPRDVLSRLETMVMMAGMDLPSKAIREQVSAALDVIVHQSRMTDGTRKITQVVAVTGMEGEVITLQEVFSFVQSGFGPVGEVIGSFKPTGMIPKFVHDARQRGIGWDLGMFKA